jgi:hypothetical protein
MSRKRDLYALIEDLRTARYTPIEIARLLGISRQRVNQMLTVSGMSRRGTFMIDDLPEELRARVIAVKALLSDKSR